MSSIADRPNTALLVVDVQNGVVEGAYKRDEVISNIEAAVAKARAANIPVVWVQHSDEELVIDTDEWQIVSELIPLEGGGDGAQDLPQLVRRHKLVCSA